MIICPISSKLLNVFVSDLVYWCIITDSDMYEIWFAIMKVKVIVFDRMFNHQAFPKLPSLWGSNLVHW